MACCAARPGKRPHGSDKPQKGPEGWLEPILEPILGQAKEQLDYLVEDYNHIPALIIPSVSSQRAVVLAAQGNARELKFYLERQPDQAKELANEPDPETGATPLLAAAKSGYNSCITVLVENGADVNQANQQGWTPLMAAVRFAERDTAQCAKTSRTVGRALEG